MVEYRLTRKRKAPAAAPAQPEFQTEQDIPEDEQASMLSKAGGAAMSGLHTIGSVLSWPSRLLHGGINAATGGEGGVGENYLNPFDSRGGIEGSQHLVRAGILSKNDPTKWEWSDLSRGLADMALDPTTYLGGLGLTAKGVRGLKAGTQATGRLAQIAKGERALVSGGIPFIAPHAFSIGSGPRVAGAMEALARKSGVAALKKVALESMPVRALRATFDASVKGLSHPTLQALVPDAVKKLGKSNRMSKADAIRIGRSEVGKMDDDLLRMQLEGAVPYKVKGYSPQDIQAPFDERHEFIHLSPKGVAGAVGEELPDAGDHLDDLINAGQPVAAPYIHLAPDGTIRTGGMASRQARRQANRQYRESVAQIKSQMDNMLPVTQSLKSRIVRAIESSQRNPGELVSFRDIRQSLPDVSKQDFDRAVMELAQENNGVRYLDIHNHDFAANLPQNELDDLVDASHFNPDMANLPANHGRYFVGASRQPGSSALPPDLALTENPAYRALEQQMAATRRSKKQTISDAEAAALQDIHAQHGADEGVMTLAKLSQLDDPLAGFMVPKSQKEEFLRRFGKGVRSARDAGLSHHEIDAMKSLAAESLARQQAAGVGTQTGLQDVVDYFPRASSVSSETKQAGRIAGGSKVMPARTAEDVTRKLGLKGNFEGTVGVNKILGDAEIHDAIAEGGWRAAYPLIRQKYGHMFENIGQGPKHLREINKHARTIASTQEKIAKLKASKEAAEQTATGASGAYLSRLNEKIGKKIDAIGRLNKKLEAATQSHNKALISGIDRTQYLAKFMAKNPELKGQKLFGNHPLADFLPNAMSVNKKVTMSQPTYDAIAKHLNEGDGGVRLGDFLKDGGYSVRKAAEKIAGRVFDSYEDMKGFLDNTIDTNLADQLKSLTPRYSAPEAVGDLHKAMKTGMSWWKGLTLAFPASRVRDAVGGAVQNVLHGWANPKFLADDTNKLLSGKLVTRDYSHVPEIQDWLAKSQLEWSPENQTEALRQLVAVHLPSEHGMLGDVPVGQTGAGVDQILHNVPGTKPTSFTRQFVTDPLKTLAGQGDTGATWFGKAEPGDTIMQRAGKAMAQPFTGVRGVGNATETTFAPVRASEQVSAASDAYNRTGPFLQMLHGGYNADVAADAVNRAQINYDPETFTATERAIKNTLLPFYSFNSRILPETARQLADVTSPTAQLVKSLDRAHAGGDPSVPDYVLAGTGIPLGQREDGTKTYATGFGLMHEPAVSTLGLLAGGNFRPAGYDLAAQLNPLVGVPLQRMTGQSFFQRGEPLSNLDPTTGRLMSNIGESLGIRDPEAGPVRYPGSKAVDAVLGATPFGRLANQARTLADPRKDVASKLVDTLSGARITDISPGKQLSTLQKRAEDLARDEGAFEARMVGFPKSQIAQLEKTDPEAAARQRHLQSLITMLKRRKVAARKLKEASEEPGTEKPLSRKKKPK